MCHLVCRFLPLWLVVCCLLDVSFSVQAEEMLPLSRGIPEFDSRLTSLRLRAEVRAKVQSETSILNGCEVAVLETQSRSAVSERQCEVAQGDQPKEDPDYLLGIALLDGLGMKVNEKKAVELLLAAARREHPLAMAHVAEFYFTGLQMKIDEAESKKWVDRCLKSVQKLANDGNADAQYVLGRFTSAGIGVPKDLVQGAKWYRLAADQNHLPAQSDLGRCYEHGEGVAKDVLEAIKLYRQSADNQLATGQLNLGICYNNGVGVSKDSVEGAKWVRKAAENNLPFAQFMFGICCLTGEGVAKDGAEGVKWLRLAADQDHTTAQYNLGLCYAIGEGVPQDLAVAATWYRKAADLNDADSQVKLGQCYTSGEGVAKDPAEAVKWYRKAADQKHPVAQLYLGHAYAQGDGIARDAAEAVHLYRIVASHTSAGPDLKAAIEKAIKDLEVEASDDRVIPLVALGQSIAFDAGEHLRIDVPVSVNLVDDADVINGKRHVRLIETTAGKETPVRIQVEKSMPLRLWWILQGKTPAGTRRTFRIDSVDATAEQPMGEQPMAVPGVVVEQTAEAIDVRCGERPVLRYNTAHVNPPAGMNQRYGRSAYLHPVWTPSGKIVTEQFPADHGHQSGLFLAYVKTEFESRTPDFWNLAGGTGRVRHKRVVKTTSGSVFGELVVEHEHVDLSGPEPRVALNETWNVRVWNVGGSDSGYWICDLASTAQAASASPLTLSKYHYGGMAIRGAGSWGGNQAKFLTSEGLDRKTGNHTRPKWCDISGPVGDQTAGLAMLTHPRNFRFPEPLRIHGTMPYMVYTPSHLADWSIADKTPHVSRYRFIIHDGEIASDQINQLWSDFGETLSVTIVENATSQ